jgi:RHS repeat-associated protein
MPMKVRYEVIDGEVIAEKRGGVRRFYVPDPLGSTVALLDNTQTPTDTFSYWPYGEERTRTGTTPTPFRYAGGIGCYRDSPARRYLRARHLDAARGLWLADDPLGPTVRVRNDFGYADHNPVSYVDRSGKMAARPPRRHPRKPKPGRGGVGPGQCPGAAAADMVHQWITESPGCAAAVKKVCSKGPGFGGTAGGAPIVILPDVPGLPDAESGCENRWRGNKCRPVRIIFTPEACREDVPTRACLLLIEVLNRCACRDHNQHGEGMVGPVLEACDVAFLCGPAGVAPLLARR